MSEVARAVMGAVLDAIDPWDRLLAAAGPRDAELARRLGLFRDCGCALTIQGGVVRFGPFDDFADSDWTDADDWRHDYDHYLAGPFGAVLRDLLVELVCP